MKDIVEKLNEMGACDGPGDAIPWVLSRPESERDLTSLWRDCPRADWMLWLAQRCKPNPEEMVSVAWACAHLAQAYAAGSGSAEAAGRAAYAASDAAAARACRRAADEAACIAAADAAADAAYAATRAASRAAATAGVDADAAIAAAQEDCADMVRLLVTMPVLP